MKKTKQQPKETVHKKKEVKPTAELTEEQLRQDQQIKLALTFFRNRTHNEERQSDFAAKRAQCRTRLKAGKALHLSKPRPKPRKKKTNKQQKNAVTKQLQDSMQIV